MMSIAESKYQPRPGKRGGEVVDAFDTSWLVRPNVGGVNIEHWDDGWFFGVQAHGRLAGYQVCYYAPDTDPAEYRSPHA